MTVRSTFPWPVRWAGAALVIGFCAAIGLWAFELGRGLAGLDSGNQTELIRLREEVLSLKESLAAAIAQRDQAQSVANTAGTLVAAEKGASEKLIAQLKQNETENRSLRDDLGFFERLVPSLGSDGLSIRGLQADAQADGKLKWQVLVIQANKGAKEFKGKLEVTFTGTLNGKPWTGTLVNGSMPITVGQYGRIQGVFDTPSQVIIKALSAKVLDGSTIKATQVIKL